MATHFHDKIMITCNTIQQAVPCYIQVTILINTYLVKT